MLDASLLSLNTTVLFIGWRERYVLSSIEEPLLNGAGSLLCDNLLLASATAACSAYCSTAWLDV
jgi:hypothetical protein